MLAERGAAQDMRARITKEARLAARINHPNVAAVYDVIEHDGRTFIVMEYVEGESLASVLRSRPMPSKQVAALGRQLTAALAAAHRVGVIHRNLKPANVHLTTDGSVKILDFGIAIGYASASTTGSGGSDTAVRAAGTPGYMSPEQMLGQKVDERGDLFSLAVVLFEMATGHRPVNSSDPLEILLAAARVLPRADGTGRQIPENLADVIAKGLAVDPNDRFPSAAEMGAAIEGTLEPERRASARRRTVAWSVAIASLPLAIWLIGWLEAVAFNMTFARPPEFSQEPWYQPFIWSVRSFLEPGVFVMLAFAAMWAGRFLLRLSGLWTPTRRLVAAVTKQLRAAAAKLALHDPVARAQSLSAFGLMALAAIVWWFNDVVRAWVQRIGGARPAVLWALGPGNETERVLYSAALTLLFLALAIGAARVVRLRSQMQTRRGTGALAALIAIMTAILLMNQVPYRIMWQNKAPQVDVPGASCYAIGENAAEWLLYCPEATPHNRIVNKGDPGVGRPGTIESIFTRMTR